VPKPLQIEAQQVKVRKPILAYVLTIVCAAFIVVAFVEMQLFNCSPELSPRTMHAGGHPEKE
jgi:hypothetical protein